MRAAVACIGGAVVDRKLHLRAPAVGGTSNPAYATTSFGGVARNVAENLARLGVCVSLVSRVGEDQAGVSLLGHLRGLGVATDGSRVVPGMATAQYVAVLDPDGSLVIGAAAMDVLDMIESADIDAAVGTLDGRAPADLVPWLFADCNLAAPAIEHAVRVGAAGHRVRVAVDAVSVPKVIRLPRTLHGVAVFFCNADEAQAWLEPGGAGAGAAEGVQAALALATRLHAAGVEQVVLTRGADGLVLADRSGSRVLPAVPADPIDVTGAGDALVAGVISALASGRTLDDAARIGAVVAALTVESDHSVHPGLTASLVATELESRAV